MAETRNVVFFPFQGDEVGGSHLSALRLIERLDTRRWRPLVALHNVRGPLAPELSSRGIPYVDAPRVALPGRASLVAADGRLSVAWRFIRCVPAFTRFLKQNKVDIVHTNDGEMHTAWSLPARLVGAHHIWHHRGDPDARGVNMLAPLLASHIVSVSRFSQPSSPLLPIGHKLSIIRSPFDHPSLPANRLDARLAALRTLDLSPETRVLGYFGSLIQRKRPILFIEIVHAFMQRHPDIPVVGLLFGVPGLEDMAAEERARARAQELEIADRIRFMGYRSPVEPWMLGVDVLVVPAVREPFGRTLIEAMFLGTPVVAANSGGNPEAITDNVTGFLVEPDDKDAFVGPIHRLLADDALHGRIGQNARSEALDAYGAEAHVRSVSQLYDSFTVRPCAA